MSTCPALRFRRAGKFITNLQCECVIIVPNNNKINKKYTHERFISTNSDRIVNHDKLFFFVRNCIFNKVQPPKLITQT